MTLISEPYLTVIIPVLNEEFFLRENLHKFKEEKDIEIIFVDGGSSDKTVELIKKYSFQVIKSPVAKRSFQMNLGARYAQGNILLFLHGDSILPDNYFDSVKRILREANVVAGAFSLKIDSDQFWLNFVSMMVDVRSHLFALPYGDQGIFLKKETFMEVGGFVEMPIMEDFELIKKLQKKGKIRIAKSAIITSSRRWKKLGIFKTTLINQLVIIGYYLKVNPDRLANFYRQLKDFK